MPDSRMNHLGRVGMVAGRYLADRVRRPISTTLDDVPAFAATITPEWMTLAMCQDLDATVTDVTHETISNGTTCRSRLHLSYAGDPTDVASLPDTVFVKSTSSFVTRLEVGVTGGASGEIRFYRDIRDTLDISAPVGYFGRADRRSGRSVLVTEDLARRPGLTFGDTRSPLDLPHAEALIDTLAVLHGSLQDSPRFDGDLRSVVSSLTLQKTLNQLVDFEARTTRGAARAADSLTPGVRRRVDDVHAYVMRSLELDTRHPSGLVHTDVHAGNWFATAEGEMGLFDWAAYARGQGVRDVAYALTSSLTVDDRRAWEKGLLERYAERLSSEAGTHHSTADTWLRYRQQLFHGLSFWLSTIGRGRLQPQMQADEVSRVNISRMSQAVEDLEGFAAIDTA